MQDDQHIFGDAPDNDTLGGRLWRAREAKGLSESSLAKAIGVRRETLRAWESDRSEPRANRLVTISGVLDVSPTWLLHGLGDAPASETVAGEISVVRAQLGRLRELRDETETVIATIEKSMARIAERGSA